jgi:orotidine 5'-phosphate decarboxylase subfamily 2
MTTAEPFGARLRRAMDDRGPVCAGIDPTPELLSRWGLPDDTAGLREFAYRAVDGLAPSAAVVKPQSAFFERHGSAGVAVLEQVISRSRAAGALVLVDAKRGDIGSTMQGYADAYLDPSSPLACDALTVNPYLGLGSLEPAIGCTARYAVGLFVLVRTSNPEGHQVQLARHDGRTVSANLLSAITALNDGVRPMGSLGAVVAANLPTSAVESIGNGPTRQLLAINGPLLAPGFGAQGGSTTDLVRTFAGNTRLVLPATSRAVLRSGPDPVRLQAAFASVTDEVRSAFAAVEDRPAAPPGVA